jgi:hypothetical protein
MNPDDPNEPGGPPEVSDPGAAVERRVTYPPKTWDREAGVVSSAGGTASEQAAPPLAPTSGSYDPRLTEARAREILGKRFAAAGAALEPDYSFREGDLMVTLDGYDPDRRIGFAFVSHADADVVTDFDEATDEAFRQLAAAARAHVLVVHDWDVPTADVLERMIDAFFHHLPR